MKIKYFAYYRQDTGRKSEELELAPLTVLELLRYLGQRYGKRFSDRILYRGGEDINHQVIVLLNGRNIDFLQGNETIVQREDEVLLFPRIAGG